ncbi:hypothetical protein D1AOALGA4SA_9321 [Olavius algarvensis Delta 1 endosymbiont]|nr:hypothetical protein D1AOALGA4SA_9321 [Olavius algarvensis Delta 1 endosymbiont]
MSSKISHDRNDESIEAKVKWFRTLNLSERMDMLCAFTDLALELNPQIPDKKQSMKYRGQTFYVVSLDDLISSKRAAGRDVDLEDVRLLEIPDDQDTS